VPRVKFIIDDARVLAWLQESSILRLANDPDQYLDAARDAGTLEHLTVERIFVDGARKEEKITAHKALFKLDDPELHTQTLKAISPEPHKDAKGELIQAFKTASAGKTDIDSLYETLKQVCREKLNFEEFKLKEDEDDEDWVAVLTDEQQSEEYVKHYLQLVKNKMYADHINDPDLQKVVCAHINQQLAGSIDAALTQWSKLAAGSQINWPGRSRIDFLKYENPMTLSIKHIDEENAEITFSANIKKFVNKTAEGQQDFESDKPLTLSYTLKANTKSCEISSFSMCYDGDNEVFKKIAQSIKYYYQALQYGVEEQPKKAMQHFYLARAALKATSLEASNDCLSYYTEQLRELGCDIDPLLALEAKLEDGKTATDEEIKKALELNPEDYSSDLEEIAAGEIAAFIKTKKESMLLKCFPTLTQIKSLAEKVKSGKRDEKDAGLIEEANLAYAELLAQHADIASFIHDYIKADFKQIIIERSQYLKKSTALNTEQAQALAEALKTQDDRETASPVVTKIDSKARAADDFKRLIAPDAKEHYSYLKPESTAKEAFKSEQIRTSIGLTKGENIPDDQTDQFFQAALTPLGFDNDTAAKIGSYLTTDVCHPATTIVDNVITRLFNQTYMLSMASDKKSIAGTFKKTGEQALQIETRTTYSAIAEIDGDIKLVDKNGGLNSDEDRPLLEIQQTILVTPSQAGLQSATITSYGKEGRHLAAIIESYTQLAEKSTPEQRAKHGSIFAALHEQDKLIEEIVKLGKPGLTPFSLNIYKAKQKLGLLALLTDCDLQSINLSENDFFASLPKNEELNRLIETSDHRSVQAFEKRIDLFLALLNKNLLKEKPELLTALEQCRTLKAKLHIHRALTSQYLAHQIDLAGALTATKEKQAATALFRLLDDVSLEEDGRDALENSLPAIQLLKQTESYLDGEEPSDEQNKDYSNKINASLKQLIESYRTKLTELQQDSRADDDLYKASTACLARLVPYIERVNNAHLKLDERQSGKLKKLEKSLHPSEFADQWGSILGSISKPFEFVTDGHEYRDLFGYLTADDHAKVSFSFSRLIKWAEKEDKALVERFKSAKADKTLATRLNKLTYLTPQLAELIARASQAVLTPLEAIYKDRTDSPAYTRVKARIDELVRHADQLHKSTTNDFTGILSTSIEKDIKEKASNKKIPEIGIIAKEALAHTLLKLQKKSILQSDKRHWFWKRLRKPKISDGQFQTHPAMAAYKKAADDFKKARRTGSFWTRTKRFFRRNWKGMLFGGITAVAAVAAIGFSFGFAAPILAGTASLAYAGITAGVGAGATIIGATAGALTDNADRYSRVTYSARALAMQRSNKVSRYTLSDDSKLTITAEAIAKGSLATIHDATIVDKHGSETYCVVKKTPVGHHFSDEKKRADINKLKHEAKILKKIGESPAINFLYYNESEFSISEDTSEKSAENATHVYIVCKKSAPVSGKIETLEAHKPKTLSATHTFDILQQVAQQLEALHTTHRLVHADLHPGNITLYRPNEAPSYQAKLVDFGETIEANKVKKKSREKRLWLPAAVLTATEAGENEEIAFIPTVDLFSFGALMLNYLFKPEAIKNVMGERWKPNKTGDRHTFHIDKNIKQSELKEADFLPKFDRLGNEQKNELLAIVKNLLGADDLTQPQYSPAQLGKTLESMLLTSELINNPGLGDGIRHAQALVNQNNEALDSLNALKAAIPLLKAFKNAAKQVDKKYGEHCKELPQDTSRQEADQSAVNDVDIQASFVIAIKAYAQAFQALTTPENREQAIFKKLLSDIKATFAESIPLFGELENSFFTQCLCDADAFYLSANKEKLASAQSLYDKIKDTLNENDADKLRENVLNRASSRIALKEALTLLEEREVTAALFQLLDDESLPLEVKTEKEAEVPVLAFIKQLESKGQLSGDELKTTKAQYKILSPKIDAYINALRGHEHTEQPVFAQAIAKLEEYKTKFKELSQRIGTQLDDAEKMTIDALVQEENPSTAADYVKIKLRSKTMVLGGSATMFKADAKKNDGTVGARPRANSSP
jgi:hypothetical protein